MRIKIVVTKEDYEKLKQFKETDHSYYSSGCSIISCDGIECDACPLNNLTIDERLEYIKNHLEEEQ